MIPSEANRSVHWPCVLKTKQVGLVQRVEAVVVNEIREMLLQQV